MKKNKILFITYHFPPAGGPSTPASLRCAAFVKYLSEYSWNLHVITLGYKSMQRIDETLPLSDYKNALRINDPIPNFKGKTRLTNYLPLYLMLWPWALKVIFMSFKLIKKIEPNVIMVSAPPFVTFLIGTILKTKARIPLVLDYRDQWSYSPYRLGPKIYKVIDRSMEGFILKHSDLIIVTNELRLKEHIICWGNNKRIININNGWDDYEINEFKDERNKNPENIIIRHLGAIYGARIKPCYEFLNKLYNQIKFLNINKKIIIEFYGYVPDSLIKKSWKKGSNIDIKYFSWVPFKIAKIRERTADYLLVITGEHNQNYAEDTSKFYEYLTTGRRIIVLGRPAEIYNKFKLFDKIFWFNFSFTDEEIKKFLYWINQDIGDKEEHDNFEELKRFHRKEQIKKLSLYLENIVK
jgi:hypothetical protein